MKKFGFFLLDGYALMSTAAALEPMRAANLFASQKLYDIRVMSLGGGQSRSSVGFFCEAQDIATAGFDFDIVFVIAGGDPLAARDTRLSVWLRELDRTGVALGGISGGALILADAGLLEKRRFTVHWHHYDQMRRVFPNLLLEQRLYLIDRDRYTCAGGAAPLDMMHAIISRDHGTQFAQRISDWFIQAEVRQPDAPQQSSITARFGMLPAAVHAAIELMETHIADPLTIAQLAVLSGLSVRQMQRQFSKSLGISVMETYRRIRLDTARALLRSTLLPIGEVAQMSGFPNQAHFTTRFTERVGLTPGAFRLAERTVTTSPTSLVPPQRS